MAKLSVIIPIYNVEKYLKQCLDSIINQTFQDLEIILVDDGSPDKCGEICDEYTKKDVRIKVIHKENGGLSSARNDAIDIATGEWVAFVDSDDWLELDIYAQAVSAGEKYDVDILFFNSFRNTGSKETKMQFFKKEFFSSDKEYIKLLQAGALCKYVASVPGLSFPWNRIIRRKLIAENKIYFAKVRACEDLIYSINCLQFASKIAYIEAYGYHYRFNELSISHQYNPNRIAVDKEVIKLIYKLGEDYHADYNFYRALNAFIVQSITNNLVRCFFHKSNKNSFLKKMKYASSVVKEEPYYTAFEKVDRSLLTEGGKLITVFRHNNAVFMYVCYLCKILKCKVIFGLK